MLCFSFPRRAKVRALKKATASQRGRVKRFVRVKWLTPYFSKGIFFIRHNIFKTFLKPFQTVSKQKKCILVKVIERRDHPHIKLLPYLFKQKPTFYSFRFKFASASIRVILKVNRPKTKLHDANCQEWPKYDKYKQFHQI